MKGTVKWFSLQKGYGFAMADDVDNDIFIYYEDIEMEGYRHLKEGDEIEFELIETHKGFQAKNIRKVG